MTINNDKELLRFAYDVVNNAKKNNLRITLDDSNESLGKKVANAEAMRIPYSVVIGSKEADSGKVTPRNRSDLPQITELLIEDLFKKLADDAQARK